MKTHTFTLPSGVECEVKELTGKHQRILTEQKSKKLGDNLNEVLVDTVVRVGTYSEITLEFIQGMLAADRKKVLVELRQFSFDYEPKFSFKYDYLGADSQGREEKKSEDMEVDLSDKVSVDEDGKEVRVSVFGVKPYATQYKEYAEVKKDITITLPKSGKKVMYRLLDGFGEQVGMNTKKADRSSHTPILMRHPREFIKTPGGETPIILNLDTLPIKDLEALRVSIKENEGQVDTEFRFEHPDAENKPTEEKQVVVDILGVLAFFFPSEAI